MAVLLAGGIARAEDVADPPIRQFLYLYANQSTFDANREVTKGLQEVFQSELGAGYEVYAEYRDFQRFPGVSEDRDFEERLFKRYSDRSFDAVLALGAAGLNFSLIHRDTFLPDVPVIFGGVGADHFGTLDLPQRYHGLVNEYDVRGTVELARTLQPDATRLVVYTGSSPQDQLWKSVAQEQLSGLDGLELEIVTDKTLAAFVEHAAALPPDTIALILTIFKDAAGVDYMPGSSAEMIAQAASVPTYGVYETYVGRGILGGQVDTFMDLGKALAETTLGVLEGEDVPPRTTAPTRSIVDWRIIEKFDIDADLIPAGTEIRNRQRSVWERYRLQILLTSAIILAQSTTIAALIFQHGRSRRAQAELAQQRLDMVHLARVAQFGELSGAIAHELNQPLTAILANAEAGARLIRREPPDLEEVADILDDIASDDRRAAGIISDLRRLMSRGTSEFEPLDLNLVVTSTLKLASVEIERRGLQVDLRLVKEGLPINGNMAQLQQVLLNLLMNATEAMSEKNGKAMRVILSTERRSDGSVRLTLRDFGPGVAPGVDPFKPFITTRPNGMGLGLPICRTIAEAHGGRLSLHPAIGGGTRAVLSVPSA